MNNKNELSVADNSAKKRLSRIIAVVLEVFFAIGIINILSEWSTSSKNEVIADCITIFLFLVYTLILIRKVFFKKNRNSMRVMKYFCSYNELNKLLKNEKFKEIKPCGIDSAYASKLWLKLDDTFIPKNFIAGAYIEVATYGVYELRMILINGKQFYYRIGSDKNNIEGTVNSIKSLVPHLKLCDDVFGKNKDIFNRAATKYKEKTKDGIDMEKLISRWTGEFEIE